MPYLYISGTKKMGKGVFTSEPIPRGSIVEISPVIVMDNHDRSLLDQTLLHDYIFEWGKNNQQCCLALGYVSIYNHSYTSNCAYQMDYDAATITIRTIQYIDAGEELFINYNGDWDDKKTVWFEAK
ncbi:MAG TPA: SET domain-containing protein [Puia sp.]|nr:SET domain-containing protein [Puia sp.]